MASFYRNVIGYLCFSVVTVDSYKASFYRNVIGYFCFSVVTVDSYMASFYRNVNGYWREYGTTNLSHVTVVSTGGGHRDYQVRNSLASLKGVGQGY
jgi:hypothetical protein